LASAPDSSPGVDVARPRFWTAAAAYDHGSGRAAYDHRSGRAAYDHGSGRAAGAALPVGGVALRGGAILMLPAVPAPGDYADIAAAAAPLLDLLAARGLLTTGHPGPTAHADDGSAR
jgi:hypothetical protein